MAVQRSRPFLLARLYLYFASGRRDLQCRKRVPGQRGCIASSYQTTPSIFFDYNDANDAEEKVCSAPHVNAATTTFGKRDDTTLGNSTTTIVVVGVVAHRVWLEKK